MLMQIDNLEKEEKKSFMDKSMKPGGFGNSLFQSTVESDDSRKMAQSMGPV